MLNNSAKNVTANSAYADQSESHRDQCKHYESDRDSKSEKICYQCQRQSHFINDCFIKTDKDNEVLSSNKDSKLLKFKASLNKVTEKLNSSKNLKDLNSKWDISENNKDSKTWKAVAAEVIVSLKLSSESWIVDFRVSHHMTLNWSFFVTFQNYSMQICLANEKIIEVTEIDKVKVLFKEEKLTLNEVLYVLRLDRNLLSIRAVSSHRITVKFWVRDVFFKHNKSIVAITKCHSSVYILKSLNREVTFKVQIYWHVFSELTASVTAERALSMSKLALKSVRAVLKYERALVNNSMTRENFTSITLRSENPHFLTQTQTDYQKWHWRFSHAGVYWIKYLKSCVESITCELHLTEMKKICLVCLHSKMIQVQNKDLMLQTIKHLKWVYSDVWELY